MYKRSGTEEQARLSFSKKPQQLLQQLLEMHEYQDTPAGKERNASIKFHQQLSKNRPNGLQVEMSVGIEACRGGKGLFFQQLL